jgi:alpha-tubulin suppressor-like RCC1 family protein
VTTDSIAYCWGRNSNGQLGDGSGDERHTPTAVVGGLRFAQVGLGVSHGCGLTTDDVVYCWGDNTWGQLGRGLGNYSFTPVRVLQ